MTDETGSAVVDPPKKTRRNRAAATAPTDKSLRDSESGYWEPLRNTRCSCCHALFDPSPGWLGANPDLHDANGNLFCYAGCKRIFDSGDVAAIEARRVEVAAGELDAFSGGKDLVSSVTI